MKCQNCKKSFKPERPNQSVCSAKCAYDFTISWGKRKKQLKKEVKHNPKSALQTIINKIIRTIDSGYPCISCANVNPTEAGHYRSRGAYPELRYDPFNIWLQCHSCNNHKGGKPIEYREGIIERYGLDFTNSILDPISDFIKVDSGNIQELKKVARKYLKTLDSDKVYSIEETIVLRQRLYEEIQKV